MRGMASWADGSRQWGRGQGWHQYIKWLRTLSPDTGVLQRRALILCGNVGVALPVDHVKDQIDLLFVSVTFLIATTKCLMKMVVSIPSRLAKGKGLFGLIVRGFSLFFGGRNGSPSGSS